MKFILGVLISVILSCCSGEISTFREAESEANILPDYSGIAIPPNIAPLNFIIKENAKRFLVKIVEDGEELITIKSNTGRISFPQRKWEKLLQRCKGKDMSIMVFIKKDGGWIKFPTIINQVTVDPIDSYLVYRLIDPGFEIWNKMGIYQRCLETFLENPVMVNSVSDKNCMNCHSFCNNDSHIMMFHMRAKNAGTIICRDGEVTKVNTKTDRTISEGVYPAWHPDGRYLAFSVNKIGQVFPSTGQIKTEVIDTLSDLIVFDTKRNKIFTYPLITSKDRFETFPSWSPDGKYLYYCSARSLPFTQYKQIRYDILRIAFDHTTCQFGSVDTIVSASRNGHSASFPRISPDGKYLLFCTSDFGNFFIWHKDSDLYIKDLETGIISKPDINSPQSESYHTWSSSGRWIVFSSRRADGLFTRLYFSYFDRSGKAYKPFLLPQKDPEFYDTFLKSYNIPELVISKIELNPYKFSDVVKSKADTITFITNQSEN